MIEFFDGIGAWLVTNTDAILLFFTSGQAVSLVIAVVSIFKQAKELKKAKTSTDTLNKSVNESAKVNDANVTAIQTFVSTFTDKLNVVINTFNEAMTLSKQLLHLSEQNANKTDAILDAMQLVYSTIKDDNIRENVSNILASAKLSDNKERVELLKTIEKLQTQVDEYSKAMNTVANEAKTVVEKKISPEKVLDDAIDDTHIRRV